MLGRAAGRALRAADEFVAVVFCCEEEGELMSLCAYSLFITSSLHVNIFSMIQEKIAKRTPNLTGSEVSGKR